MERRKDNSTILVNLIEENDLIVKELPLQNADGLIVGKNIAIRSTLETTTQKQCVLAEEIGHYITTTGNILDQNDVSNRKQERRARGYGYNLFIGIDGIIEALDDGCNSVSDLVDYFNVSEAFLRDAISYYREKHGLYAKVGKRFLCFEPLAVLEKL